MMLYLCSTVNTVQVIKRYCAQKIQCFVMPKDTLQNVKLLHLALVIPATLDRPLLFRLRRIFLHLGHISIPISLFCARAHLRLRLHLHTCTCYYTYGRRWFECTRFWDKKALRGAACSTPCCTTTTPSLLLPTEKSISPNFKWGFNFCHSSSIGVNYAWLNFS